MPACSLLALAPVVVVVVGEETPAPESLVGASSIPSRARPARTSSSLRRYLA